MFVRLVVRLVVPLVALCTVAIPATARGADLPPFDFEAARRIVGISSPAISPDGRRIAVVVTKKDFEKDHNVSAIELIDVAGGQRHILTQDRLGVGAPAWSDDGTRLAFVAQPDEKSPEQIYVFGGEWGDARKVTDVKGGVEAFIWRPKTSQIVFETADEAPNAKEIEKKLDSFEITDEHFLMREKATPRHLWSVDVSGGTPQRVTSGTWSLPYGLFTGPLAFSPDGAELYYLRQPDAIAAHFARSYQVERDMASGKERPLFGTESRSLAARVSPDGSLVAYSYAIHNTIYLGQNVRIARRDGSVVASSASIDRNVQQMVWMPDSKAVLIDVVDHAHNTLWLQPVKGSPHKVDLGGLNVAPDFSVARDGAVAFVASETTRPAELYYLPPHSASPRRLSNDNEVVARSYAFGNDRIVDWRTDAGMMADGVLTLPVGFTSGRKYPLVLVIHGGPISASTDAFSTLPQVLANHGYLVLQPNYRGSTDAGDAYLQAIVGDVTSGPGRDNLAGLHAVEAMGFVDSNRLGVSGWSGGGLQTSWLIGHTTEFKAAVSGAAVNDWVEQGDLADISEDFTHAFFPAVTPGSVAARNAYLAESPISFAQNVRTPTLILSDTGDQRVPIAQSYAFYHMLRANGVDVKFVAFPTAGHFPGDPVRQESVFRAWVGWFDQHLK